MTTRISVYLLDEGVDCWRPVDAELISDNTYRIVGAPPDDTEIWQFKTGELVRCKVRRLSGDSAIVHDCLVAYERVNPT